MPRMDAASSEGGYLIEEGSEEPDEFLRKRFQIATTVNIRVILGCLSKLSTTLRTESIPDCKRGAAVTAVPGYDPRL
jgi:hypothetical protein